MKRFFPLLQSDENIRVEIESAGDFQTKIQVEVTKANMFLAERHKSVSSREGRVGARPHP